MSFLVGRVFLLAYVLKQFEGIPIKKKYSKIYACVILVPVLLFKIRCCRLLATDTPKNSVVVIVYLCPVLKDRTGRRADYCYWEFQWELWCPRIMKQPLACTLSYCLVIENMGKKMKCYWNVSRYYFVSFKHDLQWFMIPSPHSYMYVLKQIVKFVWSHIRFRNKLL